jgi:formylglycine-generating enzyme required for sulfatase activity
MKRIFWLYFAPGMLLAFSGTALATAPLYPPLVTADGKPKAAAYQVHLENGEVELALQVLAPGKTLEAVRIDNVGGRPSLWRSDGKDKAAPLAVKLGEQTLSSGAEAMSFVMGEAEVLLSLSLKDNGAFAGGDTDFRVTVFFAGGDRALCQVEKAGPSAPALAVAPPAKAEPPEAAEQPKPEPARTQTAQPPKTKEEKAHEAQAQEKTFANSIGLEMVLIPAGSFMMGSDKGVDREKPVHKVTISRPFYLGKYPVTQAQWEAVMGSNPSEHKGRDNPVDSASWDDVQGFIKRLNAKEGHDRYRLPTEAEWEYAARAGTTTEYFYGDDQNEMSKYAWYKDNSGGKTQPVGQKKPNPWGLHDVHGNVWEWVEDLAGSYSEGPRTDPKGQSVGSDRIRVFRGVSFDHAAEHCRSAARGSSAPDNRFNVLGFRLALSPGQ